MNREHTMNEAIEQAVNHMLAPPLVKMDSSGFIFTADGGASWDYDIEFDACGDAGSALRWIEHLSHKTWVTVEHLEQFSRLAAEHFKAPY